MAGSILTFPFVKRDRHAEINSCSIGASRDVRNPSRLNTAPFPNLSPYSINRVVSLFFEFNWVGRRKQRTQGVCPAKSFSKGTLWASVQAMTNSVIASSRYRNQRSNSPSRSAVSLKRRNAPPPLIARQRPSAASLSSYVSMKHSM